MKATGRRASLPWWVQGGLWSKMEAALHGAEGEVGSCFSAVTDSSLPGRQQVVRVLISRGCCQSVVGLAYSPAGQAG